MDIKKQVLSIEQMQHLKRLGLDTSDATMCWIKTPKGRDVAFNDDWIDRRESLLDPIPAYTLQDILAKLPNRIEIKDDEFDLNIRFYNNSVSMFYSSNVLYVYSFLNLLFLNQLMKCSAGASSKDLLKQERRKRNENT